MNGSEIARIILSMIASAGVTALSMTVTYGRQIMKIQTTIEIKFAEVERRLDSLEFHKAIKSHHG